MVVLKNILLWVLGSSLVLYVGCQSPRQTIEAEKNGPGLKTKSRAPSNTLEFSVFGMTCENCANSARKTLEAVPGVRQALVTFETKKGRITTRSDVTKDQIQEALGTLGFEAQFADDPPRLTPLSGEQKANLDIKTVSHGESIRIEEHLAPRKYTIFDYFAEWCGPCHLLTPKLERLVLQHKNVALRKVDISNWESEVAQQVTKEFKLPGLPYVRVYGPDGKFLGAVHGNQIEKIEEVIRRYKRAKESDR